MYKEACDLGLKITRTEQECKIDYDLLLEKHNCNLKYRTYLKLIKCNISFNLINEALSSGLNLSVRSNTPYLTTPMGEYELCQLTPENINYLTELGKKVTITKQDILIDYK